MEVKEQRQELKLKVMML